MRGRRHRRSQRAKSTTWSRPRRPSNSFVITPDSQRTYYRLNTGGVWMYDRNTNATSQIVDGVVWDLAVSNTKDVLAYTKVGDTRHEQQVWVLPLSAATGLPSAKERKVSTHSGDV
jgi:hypothetical protein